MHFYSHLITVLFPFVILNPEGGDNPPSGKKFVVTYTNTQVVTYTGARLIAVEV
jgi:hypothetical protein